MVKPNNKQNNKSNNSTKVVPVKTGKVAKTANIHNSRSRSKSVSTQQLPQVTKDKTSVQEISEFKNNKVEQSRSIK